MQSAPPLTSYRKYWAKRFGTAPALPMSRAEMDKLGWDSCDIIIVTGDAYIDHPSFGMALIGRLLENQGFRVGIISQPDWHSPEAFRQLGKPNLYFGITAGNMDSMVNRYTSERKIRSDDAYTPGGLAGKRPDRALVVYAQRAREAYPDATVIVGGIEASLRRIAHYDYWSDKVRHSVLPDSKADMLLFGNAERALVELTHRLAAGEAIAEITDLRGTAFMRSSANPPQPPFSKGGSVEEPQPPFDKGGRRGDLEWHEIDSTHLDLPGHVTPHPDPYQDTSAKKDVPCSTEAPPAPATHPVRLQRLRAAKIDRARSVVRLPAYEQVRDDPVLYAHASRVLHLESNPGNARALVQRHGARDVWINPPPIPLTTAEMDHVFGLPYNRLPHPSYGEAKIPAYEMIRFSVNIMRGCFGGCTFCSITEHEGRIIQSRSEQSILTEIEEIRDKTPGFTGIISDLGGPTANMYRLACKSREIESACRLLSCVYPDICSNLGTDHGPLIHLYRKARALPGIKKILIGSGLRYDLAVRSPEYIKELVTHHVGGYLKIAPEHTEPGPLSKMMKPGIGSYDKFKTLFDKFSKEAGKEQYLIPYFIAAHPGTTDEDMLNLALWLKRNGFRLDQVQTFLPSPMALATTMYHSGKNPLRKVTPSSESVVSPKRGSVRALHKALLRYHHADNWPMIREALRRMGRADLIGNGKQQLVPAWQPAGTGHAPEGARRPGQSAPGKRAPQRAAPQAARARKPGGGRKKG